jgi:hypothetical protein
MQLLRTLWEHDGNHSFPWVRDVPRWNRLGGRDGVPNQGELGAPRDLVEAD